MKRTYEDLKESKSGKNIVKDIIDVFTTYFCQNYESLLNYEGGNIYNSNKYIIEIIIRYF